MVEKYTVLGAGHGGKAMAAHLALMGMDVALWNRTFEHISIIKTARRNRAGKPGWWASWLWKIESRYVGHRGSHGACTGHHGCPSFFSSRRYCENRGSPPSGMDKLSSYTQGVHSVHWSFRK